MTGLWVCVVRSVGGPCGRARGWLSMDGEGRKPVARSAAAERHGTSGGTCNSSRLSGRASLASRCLRKTSGQRKEFFLVGPRTRAKPTTPTPRRAPPRPATPRITRKWRKDSMSMFPPISGVHCHGGRYMSGANRPATDWCVHPGRSARGCGGCSTLYRVLVQVKTT